jgi:penicillin amidase
MRNTKYPRPHGRAIRRLSLAVGLALAGLAGSASAQSPITAPGLRAAGSIVYDREGVPVIRAANELDAAYLLGYAHARDRFWQMDFNRRGASGTVAELVGSAALANDVQIRTLGLRRAAEASWRAMSAETRGWLKAYADGVNFWLQTNPLPPEYGALELTRAEPWSPVDSVVIGKALAFQLSFDLDTGLTQAFGAFQVAGTAGNFNGQALFFEDIYRVQPPDNRVSIPGFRPTGDAPLVDDLAKNRPADSTYVQDAVVTDLAARYSAMVKNHPLIGPALEPREDRGASNWWLVGGSRTESGRPILANDPHLGLDTPSVFQEVHITAGNTINVRGGSVPGAPGVILGCRPEFCWGLTTNPMDVTDTFQENFVLNTFGLPTHTIYQGRLEPVEILVQTYNVNRLDNIPDNVTRDNSIGYTNGGVTVLVPRRNNGPVVVAPTETGGRTGLSVQYAGWGATFELEAFRRISLATNFNEFRSALDSFDVGSQNFAYAGTDGTIAYIVSAEMPIRDDLQNLRAVDGSPPFLVRDGSGTRRNEWLVATTRPETQALPYQILGRNEMPSSINPASGYIANANNDPVGNTLDNNPFNQLRANGGLYYLNFGYSAYRMGRIDRELQRLLARPADQKITLTDMQRLQANNQFMDAELVLPYLLTAASNAAATSAWSELRTLAADQQVQTALLLLRAWDFSSPTGIREGYDFGDDPTNLRDPSTAEVANSVGATLWSTWRSFAVRNTVDATLTRIGLGSQIPGSDTSYTALKNLLDNFATRRGVGASGVNFFQVANAPSPEAARDFLLLRSLRDALTMLASEGFAPAFNRSTNLGDYRWGRLHRIVFDHPLGGPFNLPGTPAYGFTNLSPQLPGIARGGGYEVVDASGHSVRANTVNGFMFGSGPARRFLSEMTDGYTPLQILPGGQSGVLGSPFYASQLSRWLVNAYKPMPLNVTVATTNPLTTISFQPR